MAVNYSNLVNKGGTIYNTQTGQGYSSPTQLAADLGVAVSAINWSSIQTNNSYTPGAKLGGSTPIPAPTPTPTPTPAPVATPASTAASVNTNPALATSQARAAGQPDPSVPASLMTSGTPTNVAAAPSNVNFINSAAYQALSPDEQAMINTLYNTYATGTSQQQNLLVQATTAAAANADPYYKSLMDITMGEFGAQVAQENNNFSLQSQIIQTTQQNLLANVNNSESGLSLENQADLAKISLNYNDQVLGIQNSSANTGTAEGTGYGTLQYATGLASAQEQNTIMSTNAAYNTQLNALQLSASQGNVQAQQQLTQLQQTHAANINSIGTTAEQAVGTANVGNIPGLTAGGYTALGGNNGSGSDNTGFIGSINEAQSKDVLTGISNYLGIAQPSVSATGTSTGS